jgi:hypothetical protein
MMRLKDDGKTRKYETVTGDVIDVYCSDYFSNKHGRLVWAVESVDWVFYNIDGTVDKRISDLGVYSNLSHRHGKKKKIERKEELYEKIKGLSKKKRKKLERKILSISARLQDDDILKGYIDTV